MATEAAGVGLWSWNVDTDKIDIDECSRGIWGVEDANTTFEELSARIHPADLGKVRAVFAATRERRGPYEHDFRILHDDGIRWVSARGRGDDQGIVDRIMYGVFIDVTTRKTAEELREVLTGEMHHRVKNLFAVAGALAQLSSPSAKTKDDMAGDLQKRLRALAVAHDLIRPEFGHQAKAVPLHELLSVLLEPYAEARRVVVSAPHILVGEKSATSLALVFHELATNSIKYGALSTPSGALEIHCDERDSEVSIVWRESGGPPVPPPDGKAGFGTRLVTANVQDQLQGSISTDWARDGLVITLQVSAALLGA
jgi:two-component sensor histidine kinase